MKEIDSAFLKHKNDSLFELYLAKQQTHAGTPENQVIRALIQHRKDRRDWWTLFAVLVGTGVSVLALATTILVWRFPQPTPDAHQSKLLQSSIQTKSNKTN